MCRLVAPTVLVLGFLFIGASAARAAWPELLTNGDFETGDLSGWTTFTTSNGTIGSPAVVQYGVTGSGASYALRLQAAEVEADGTDQGGGVEQTVNVPATGGYTFSASAIGDTGGANDADCGLYSLLIDGSTRAFASHQPCRGPLQVSLSASASLTAGAHTLEMLVTHDGPEGDSAPIEYIDNVSLVPQLAVRCIPASVPLGGTSTCEAARADPRAAPVPAGSTVAFSVPAGDGSFAPSSCTLGERTVSFASCSVSYEPPLAAGSGYTVTATSGTHGATTNVTVMKAASQTAVVCAPASVAAGMPSTCTATVSGASPRPGGTVTFTAGATPVGGCTLPVSGADGCVVSFTPSAPVTVTASYSGDANYLTSVGSATIAMTAAPPLTHTLPVSLPGKGRAAAPRVPARLRVTHVGAKPVRAGCAVERARIAADCTRMRVAVRGKISRKARGHVRVNVAVTLGGRRRTVHARALIRHGRWHATLRVPGIDRDPNAPLYVVTARFKGSRGVRPARAGRHIRLEIEPAGLDPR
ncbi:MAG TPA: Ig-like domain repeat protein [Solirubrobacteraceae bacterium]|nr:Ig-like domain repeat protein [Solirubrobacteraceae bacterium]